VRSELGLAEGQVLGPAPLFRVKDRCRSTLLVKVRDRAAVVQATGSAVQSVARRVAGKGVALSVDVDPQ
jgi:primosomal protein N' (replication factor Y)